MGERGRGRERGVRRKEERRWEIRRGGKRERDQEGGERYI